MPFTSTPPKDLIRSSFDKDRVFEFSGRKKRTLSYFGLCGPEMLDIIEWRDFLGPCCAIEYDDPLKMLKLWDTAFQEGLDTNLQVLHGDIDRIMRDWRDINGTVPSQPSYDVLNLDYEGGIVVKDLSGDSRRLYSIRRMLERQSESREDFLLFMTVNTRNRGQSEFDLTLQDIERDAKDWGVEISPVIDWYSAQGFDQKLKVYLPYVMGQYVLPLRFDLVTLNVVSYVGSGNNRMVHFVFEMRYQKERAGVGRKQSLLSLLKSPLVKAEGGKFTKDVMPKKLIDFGAS